MSRDLHKKLLVLMGMVVVLQDERDLLRGIIDGALLTGGATLRGAMDEMAETLDRLHRELNGWAEKLDNPREEEDPL